MQRKLRLKRRSDFRKVYNFGRSFANRELVLFVNKNNGKDNFRIGISVSKKIGKAVTRNLVKRRIKNALIEILKEIKIINNVDIVIIARAPTAKMNYEQFNRSLRDLLKKSNLIEKN